MRIKGLILAVAVASAGWMTAGAGLASAGSLYQELDVHWSDNAYANHDRASFQIPGVGIGDVTCSPNTTWIQMTPSNPSAENDFWVVTSQTKQGVFETAVRDARVYRYSTPTSTVPHGTGLSAYIGFNTQTPVESADSGSLIGLISRRNALNTYAGFGSAPTSVHLSWAWSGFGTAQATCQVTATFITPIAGPSRRMSEGAPESLPAASAIGPVSAFNVNWHGEANYGASLHWPSTLAVPTQGDLHATCQPGASGLDQLTLTPAARTTPYAAITTFQGEGQENAVVDDYYTDPTSGILGPIPLPVNGFIEGTILPAWNASGAQQTQLLISSIRKTNDRDSADNYCEVAVQAISSPDPLF
jgi:hypothetical protein